MPKFVDTLASFSARPAFGSEQYRRWIEQSDFISFLESIDQLDELALYASASHLFLHAVLVPADLLSPPDKTDLDAWSGNPFSTWGITVSLGDGGDVFISPPLDGAGSKTIEQGEQLVFSREFEGRQEDRSYVECAQRLTHVFDLHFVPERSAYCRFDERGDIEDVIRIVELRVGADDAGRAVTIRRAVLDEYMVLTGQLLILMFDSTRFTPSSFGGWSNGPATYRDLSPSIFYRSAQSGSSASYLRGIALIAPRMTHADVLRRHGFGITAERQYASFIAHDWKHGVVRECSSDPAELGNYFVESDFPYETTPVFFRADVLQKYKADFEKYEVRDRSITCRNAWHLQTYDINAEGQVHTYLIYLSHLPYEEQWYWKSFNEAPKGPISKRAYKSDFAGEWTLDYDPLPALKHRLSELGRKRVPWWKLRGSELLDRVHYPVTSGADEWSREIHALDKLVVEGFEETTLRALAAGSSIGVDPTWKSLKLIAEILRAAGQEEDEVMRIVQPLRDIHSLRSKLSGHASGEEARQIKKQVIKTHKTYAAHFRNLCALCDSAIAAIQKLLEGDSKPSTLAESPVRPSAPEPRNRRARTPWFPGGVAPVRIGVYERQGTAGPFSLWDGATWCVEAASPNAANAITEASSHQDAPWRGLSASL